MRLHRWTAALAALLLSAASATAQGKPKEPAPTTPDEPMAAKLSLARSAEFLDGAALAWTEKRKCGSCHTNYAYLMARPSLKQPDGDSMAEIRKFFETRATKWDTDKPRWDTEVVATAVSLAMNDAATTKKLHPATRSALDRMWKLQRPDGAWNWLKCDWPPLEHDDYYGAVWAAVGVGLAPDDYAKSATAKDGVARLLAYLKKTPPPDLHHRAMLLWASQRLGGLLTKDEQQAAVEQLLKAQRPDGGWSLFSLGDYRRHDKAKTKNEPGPGDGYGTGFVVYVLRQAGVAADHPALRRGVEWLRNNQRESGRWFTRSPSTDRNHYIAHAGTAFAVLALSSCGVNE